MNARKRRFDGSDSRELPYVVPVIYAGVCEVSKKIAAPRNFAYDLLAEPEPEPDEAAASRQVRHGQVQP
jgi:hypothetical protein